MTVPKQRIIYINRDYRVTRLMLPYFSPPSFSLHIFIFPSIYLSICLYVSLSLSLSTYKHFYRSICPAPTSSLCLFSLSLVLLIFLTHSLSSCIFTICPHLPINSLKSPIWLTMLANIDLLLVSSATYWGAPFCFSLRRLPGINVCSCKNQWPVQGLDVYTEAV